MLEIVLDLSIKHDPMHNPKKNSKMMNHKSWCSMTELSNVLHIPWSARRIFVFTKPHENQYAEYVVIFFQSLLLS